MCIHGNPDGHVQVSRHHMFIILKNKAILSILWRYISMRHSIIFAFFFTHFSMTILVPVCFLKTACLGKTHFLEKKFGGEHFLETIYTLPVPRSVSCRSHRRWIKSIVFLFLLHNAGNVSVLTDPQLINGQDRCCDHGNWSITKSVASESKNRKHMLIRF